MLQKAIAGLASKGHLISKCLFGVFKFSQKTNENKSNWGIIVVKSKFLTDLYKKNLTEDKRISMISQAKGQLISKGLFGVLNSPKKWTNKNST